MAGRPKKGAMGMMPFRHTGLIRYSHIKGITKGRI
jgi:hypothetical protein